MLALKGNQGALRDDVEVFAAEQKAKDFKDAKVTRHETVDGDHGRIETRTLPIRMLPTPPHVGRWLAPEQSSARSRGTSPAMPSRERKALNR